MKSYKKLIGLLLMLTVLVAACSTAPEAAMGDVSKAQPQDAVEENAAPAADEPAGPVSLIISEGPVQCVGVGTDCLQVKPSEDAEWETLQGQIEGFEYEVGYRYVVDVEPAGGGNLYKLVEVREKNDVSDTDGNDIANTFWVLNGFGGMAQPDSVHTNVQISFQFDPETNQVYGRSGCNNYFGEVAVDYARMTFTVAPMGMTRMACPEEVMAQENAYLDVLGRAASFAVEDGKLFLFTSANEVMIFGPGDPSSGR